MALAILLPTSTTGFSKMEDEIHNFDVTTLRHLKDNDMVVKIPKFTFQNAHMLKKTLHEVIFLLLSAMLNFLNIFIIICQLGAKELLDSKCSNLEYVSPDTPLSLTEFFQNVSTLIDDASISDVYVKGINKRLQIKETQLRQTS